MKLRSSDSKDPVSVGTVQQFAAESLRQEETVVPRRRYIPIC